MKEEIEIAKNDVNNSLELGNIYGNPVVQLMLSSVAAMFPPASLLIEFSKCTASTFLVEHQKRKREIFFKEIMNDETVTIEDVKSVEAIIEFKKNLDLIDHLSTNEKIVYLAKLYSGFVKSEEKNIDEYEEILLAFNELSEREIKLLQSLYEFEEKEGSEYRGTSDCWDRFVTENEVTISRTELESSMLSIMRTGFCICTWPLQYGREQKIVAYTTPKFQRLINKIFKPTITIQ